MTIRLFLALAALWLTIIVCTILDSRNALVWAGVFIAVALVLHLASIRLDRAGKLHAVCFEHRGVRYALTSAFVAMALVILVFAGLQIWYLWRFA